MRTAITTPDAPKAIGPYSQAIRAGTLVYTSGQIPLDPKTGELEDGPIDVQAKRVFDNLKAVCAAAGGSFKDVVRVGIYLTDLSNFQEVNTVMAHYFEPPYPARSTIGVASLPRGAEIEIDLVMVVG